MAASFALSGRPAVLPTLVSKAAHVRGCAAGPAESSLPRRLPPEPRATALPPAPPRGLPSSQARASPSCKGIKNSRQAAASSAAPSRTTECRAQSARMHPFATILNSGRLKEPSSGAESIATPEIRPGQRCTRSPSMYMPLLEKAWTTTEPSGGKCPMIAATWPSRSNGERVVATVTQPRSRQKRHGASSCPMLEPPQPKTKTTRWPPWHGGAAVSAGGLASTKSSEGARPQLKRSIPASWHPCASDANSISSASRCQPPSTAARMSAKVPLPVRSLCNRHSLAKGCAAWPSVGASGADGSEGCKGWTSATAASLATGRAACPSAPGAGNSAGCGGCGESEPV
mmetsp:Transcript_51797/g.143402  ORF Transcript_51797/g.143402 Transcript_51797/m.143402 type:complete len:343 (+) Transcript_51797:398-1426(+)